MNTDLYTKAVLTVIAVSLVWISITMQWLLLSLL